MAIIISDVKLPLSAGEGELNGILAKKCGVDAKEILSSRLLRRALDARKKNDIHFLVTAEATLEGRLEKRLLARGEPFLKEKPEPDSRPPVHGDAPCPGRIVVAGLGPGGLFAGWLLAREGYAPLILERGGPVEDRAEKVERFWQGGPLDMETNVMFGEGGAGTFSDGKLTSRSKDPRGSLVLETLRAFGAPEDILIDAKPHIGTDKLRCVVSAMRREIQRLGGEIRFHTRLSGLISRDGALTHVLSAGPEGVERIPCGALVLAIGQGARDTYRMLFDGGVAMGKKPFAVGVRAEHPQQLINTAQFGALAGHPRLGAAEYRLTGRSGERGVYTFCMCPGGWVIAGSSGAEQVVVNGMSDHARDGENANAAIVVQVFDTDTPEHPLAGMLLQEKMERDAFLLGGGDYTAPASRIGEFLSGRPSGAFRGVVPSYRPGVKRTNLADCLPDFVAAGVRDGIRAFGRQLGGYDLPDGVLTGTETRTSAPLRILRDQGLESVSHRGLYPVGEGAGYAGGIVSAAIDGLRAAEAVMGKFRPEQRR